MRKNEPESKETLSRRAARGLYTWATMYGGGLSCEERAGQLLGFAIELVMVDGVIGKAGLLQLVEMGWDRVEQKKLEKKEGG